MSVTKRSWLGLAAVAVTGSWVIWTPAAALAEPTPETPTEAQPAQTAEVLHNVIYRARVDGVSRGAKIRYRAEGNELQTAEPTMIPGRVFEANTVLPASEIANMRVSIEWPYSANLHCEILVDDALVAQADDFIGPRATPQRDDPDFGTLTCQVPVSGIANEVPVDPAAPVDPAEAPAEAQPPLEVQPPAATEALPVVTQGLPVVTGRP
ncbi:MAG: hypothetical protein ACPGVY_01285 [Mycobacterium sp.]